MFCPQCGQMTSRQPSLQQRSKWLEQLDSDHSLSCLCYTSRKDLEKSVAHLEGKLGAIVKESFSEVGNLDDLRWVIDKMDRDNPLRAELSMRMAYIARLKARIQELPDEDEVKEQVKADRARIERDNRHGRIQSFKDWLRNS